MDLLTDDALLTVFSFLAVLEKCRIARVCQRFNALVQNGSLWRYIDASRVASNRSSELVPFLQRYACQSTRFLRLGLVDNTILVVVRQNCDSLQQLSLTIDPTRDDLSLLPGRLQWLRISCRHVGVLTESVRFGMRQERFTEINLEQLQYLGMKVAIVDNVFCQKLTESPTLRQLRFDHCEFLADVNLQKVILGHIEMIELDNCRFSSAEEFYRTAEIIGENINLFGLGLIDPSFTQPLPVGSVSLDNLLLTVCERGTLRFLNVNAPGFCTVRESTLVKLFKSLHQLEVLSLEYNQSMTDRVLNIVTPENNSRLMVLNLYGNRSITDAGIEALSHHPTLRALCVGACLNLSPATVLQVAATIPNLIILGMSRPMPEFSTALSQFEMQNPETVIEYSYDNWISHAGRITQLLSEYEMKNFI